MASIYHDDSPRPFQKGPTYTGERKIPKYFEAIRYSSEFALIPRDLKCYHSPLLQLRLTGPGNKVSLGESLAYKVSSRWSVDPPNSHVSSSWVRMDILGIWCSPHIGSLAYWEWAITEGRPNGSLRNCPHSPSNLQLRWQIKSNIIS